MERRHDIDWLRVVAIGLLIIYHTAIGFQPWGVFIRFIQNNETIEWLWYPMAMLNIWRIPILFFVSGMGVRFAMRNRNIYQLLIERSKRILLPFLLGVVAIVPIHIIIWQKYYNQDLSYVLEKGHLWFLLNIYTYVIIIVPVIYLIKSKLKIKLSDKILKFFKHPWIFLYVSTVFAILAYIAQPESYTFYAISWHGYFMGLAAFLTGYLIIALGNVFWKGLRIWKYSYLFAALILFAIRIYFFEMNSPYFLMAIESVCWIFGMFGMFYCYFNKGSKTLTYLSKAAYPVYINHMVFLYLSSYFIFPLNLPAIIKYLIVVIFTYAASFATYEFIIRRINILKPLFGVKTNINFGKLTIKTYL